MQRSRLPVFTGILLASLLSPIAHAQVKPTAKPTTKSPAKTPAAPVKAPTVTSTYNASGSVDVNDIQSGVKLNRLEQAKKDLDTELDNIQKLKQAAKDPCEQEELDLRQRDAEFAKKYAGQIEAIIGDIRKGLLRQRTILRGFENGVADGEEAEDYVNTEGKADRSAMVEFSAYVDDGKLVRKKVPLKDVIRYVRKFEAEAATIADNAKDVEAFMDRYRQPENQNKPEYYNLTLEQAIKAYSQLVSSVFAVSNQEMMSRKLVIGSGKHTFQVRTTTTLGYNPQYNTVVGSTLQAAKAKKVRVELIQDFGVAFKTAEEDRYWDVIRDQQLTIDGIPIDGLKRREYFDGLRSAGCVSKVKYNFNQKSKAGPFLDYSQKEECKNHGLEILSASVTSGVDGEDSIYDFTDRVKVAADHKYDFKVDATQLSVPTSLLKKDVAMKIRYRCGCDRAVKEAVKIQALDTKPTRCGWGCGNAVPDHLVGWAYEEIQSVLTRARAIYGENVILEIITTDDVRGYNPHSAISTIQQVFGNRGYTSDNATLNRNLGSLRMTHVDSLSGEAASYLFDYRIVLPGDIRSGSGEKTLSVGREKSQLLCPQD